MAMNKNDKLDLLIRELRNERRLENISKPFINQFSLHETISDLWFDWTNKLDSKIMIIGQDWGPYVYLAQNIQKYKLRQNKIRYNDFISEMSQSKTEKFIFKMLSNLNLSPHNDIFFTVAILFCRTGTKFRGNDSFDQKHGFDISYPYIAKQIDIVRPKIIMTLGKLAYDVVDKKFSLGKSKLNLSQVIDSASSTNGVIKIYKEELTIIPNYHPAAHVRPEIQEIIWKKLLLPQT
jgi:uracil-DNA glycosylase family 4